MSGSVCPEHFGAVTFELRKHNWKYRGEGNANIALSLPDERQLIRLPKFGSNDTLEEVEIWRRLSTNILFISVVMKQILGPMFVSPSSLIYLPHNEIEYLNQELDVVRPDSRKHKKLAFCGGEICDDHAFIPKVISEKFGNQSVCIELKLKQGIFPPAESQLKNCAFCCKQELKLRDGSCSERSKYCPLDMFSGHQERMIYALKSLFLTPQNNLRIFCDGNLVFGDGYSIEDLQLVLTQWMHCTAGSDLFERLSCLLVQALTKKVNNNCDITTNSPTSWFHDGAPRLDSRITEQYGSINEDFPLSNKKPCDFERETLPEGCILHHLAQAQSLDQYGVVAVYNMLMSDQHSVIASETKSASSNTDYVHGIMKKRCSSQLSPIELYLISATVRDCSLLICFQELKDQSFESLRLPTVEDEPSKTKYIFKITAVDLDPKPLSCIKSHMKRNAMIQDACIKAALAPS
ncbi:Inositol-pentakisphosphate 2-kinase [Frankliniella fusca]|uniref:Inositol-pentakisphosphate 2-kinase n=1 Tax=Frankliniella fusca TaxID=407009 RepID=A0AAE1GV00_9NEOP|nr:Inositol-pentakisphosphate 2-kinase [Frankliniella fusca]